MWKCEKFLSSLAPLVRIYNQARNQKFFGGGVRKSEWADFRGGLPRERSDRAGGGSGRWVSPPPPPVTAIMYAYGYVPRERPPFSALNFRSGAYHFHKLPKKSVPEQHHFTFFGWIFAVPETIILKISSIWTRSSPPTAGSARTQSVWQRRGFAAVPEIRIFTLKMDYWARSEDSHFHAQKGSSSFRSPAFSSSKWVKLVPEPHIFTLDREARSGALAHFSLCRSTYLPKFGVHEYTPPPPPPRVSPLPRQRNFCIWSPKKKILKHNLFWAKITRIWFPHK